MQSNELHTGSAAPGVIMVLTNELLDFFELLYQQIIIQGCQFFTSGHFTENFSLYENHNFH